ncbi:MAG: family 2 glycosyl transferase [Elusimicrobia bacterium]|nr:MAG: family 2 glycosyl transferase [Elusimicrobiota bacterium]KAF0154993.1 MAG: family 2 glycosyl transferase [Elusimicrobiota bacterium]
MRSSTGPTHPGISVVIPNYNGADLLAANLPGLFEALAFSGADHEVIISDDASTDGSVAFLKENYPGIVLLTSPVNTGFSPNINRGIARASKELTFLMNTDIRLEKDFFVPLFDYFSDPEVFGVMGRIVGMNDDKTQDSAKYPKWNGLQVDGSANYLPSSGTRAPSLFLSGAEALVETEKLKSLGGFDEAFAPFYGEDLDLGLRAWRGGWTCWYEHSAVCRHKTSSTISRHNKPGAIRAIAARNKFRLHYIHLDLPSLLLWIPVVLLNLIVKSLTLKFYYPRGLALFLRDIGAAAASRRKVPDKYTLRQVYRKITRTLSADRIR